MLYFYNTKIRSFVELVCNFFLENIDILIDKNYYFYNLN